ncbi:MAG: hydroxymethylglutaryl-CoA synthase [Gammaproteobacteria bacterium]|nr:hydroxymethylglutaryl-CoA synthase [Gammaproteobacteria bacterium]
MTQTERTPVGISGIAIHVPPYRVRLEDWCEWNAGDWGKVHNVIGNSFRMLGPQQSVYTMAANSILRLIERYDINPENVGFLGLGTESSTDNSAGAIIVKGIVDEALIAQGKAPLSRHCEVPEFKHACLGGIYALKNGLRYLTSDGGDRQAIVVCSDIALYERNSSGEPTQGAGAVAMLLDKNPTLASIDLTISGSASSYRAVDFRKPIAYKNGTGQIEACRDIPVFNGKYSTSCYVDEVLRALEEMYARRNIEQPADYLRSIPAVFMHRPFRRMPETGWGMAWLHSLASGKDTDKAILAGYCEAADVDTHATINEIISMPDVAGLATNGCIDDEVFPLSNKVLRALRKLPDFKEFITQKMSLGSAQMMDLGNIYSGALPAWLAAGFDEALEKNTNLENSEVLLVAYGSGDAAEAIPVTIMPGWKKAAEKIQFAQALEATIDLTVEQYLALRDRADTDNLGFPAKNECIVTRVGKSKGSDFQDAGIEYYGYIPS